MDKPKLTFMAVIAEAVREEAALSNLEQGRLLQRIREDLSNYMSPPDDKWDGVICDTCKEPAHHITWIDDDGELYVQIDHCGGCY